MTPRSTRALMAALAGSPRVQDSWSASSSTLMAQLSSGRKHLCRH
jgi:hypothetical protein